MELFPQAVSHTVKSSKTYRFILRIDLSTVEPSSSSPLRLFDTFRLIAIRTRRRRHKFSLTIFAHTDTRLRRQRYVRLLYINKYKILNTYHIMKYKKIHDSESVTYVRIISNIIIILASGREIIDLKRRARISYLCTYIFIHFIFILFFSHILILYSKPFIYERFFHRRVPGLISYEMRTGRGTYTIQNIRPIRAFQ